MNATATHNWFEANQRCLTAALGVVRAMLERRAVDSQGASDGEERLRLARQRLEDTARAMPAPPALEVICALFGLSPFERDTLLLCAGVELDSTFAQLCASVQGDSRRTAPTFSLALAALPDAHWSAISPARPLRYWRLVEVGMGDTLTLSPLRIDERVLHYLIGVPHIDERLMSLVEPVQTPGDPAPSQQVLATRLAAVWSKAVPRAALPVIELCGDEDPAGKHAVAANGCTMLGLDLYWMAAHTIPSPQAELDALIRLWSREAVLSRCVLYLDCEDGDGGDMMRESVVNRLIEGVTGLLIVADRERRRLKRRSVITLDVHKPTASEQHVIWKNALSAEGIVLRGDGRDIETLASQFNLSAPAIRAACSEARGRLATVESNGKHSNADAHGGLRPPPQSEDPEAALWEACKMQARPCLGDLAQRIRPSARWGDLVVPEPQKEILREIVVHARQRLKVHDIWGFSAKCDRGMGISALFVGVSGTGKTMAAEVLAGELRLDLYRIDLSSVVSKYIGETEKNLRRVFDAAEQSGVILLFDEADALFGRRSEVKDSHDRYANVEISYLLQRMEAYRGLAILTSNMKDALDTAFLRRIRFIVRFPFPDAAQRAEIWRNVFPADTPTEGLDMEKLARLNVAGGSIRNIALNAAFLAADACEPVRMSHLLAAARTEYAKLERSLTDAEIGGWT